MPRKQWPWVLAGVLALVMVSLSWAYVQSTLEDGMALSWPKKQATLNLRVGCPAAGPCWNTIAREAAETWSQAGSQFLFFFETPSHPAQKSCDAESVDGLNTVVWAADICGMAFGKNTLAITGSWAYENGDMADADVLFNTAYEWDVYDGPLRPHPAPLDFRRVALHEFGHVLGLGHPDDHGQRVHALMNSDGGSVGVDRLQADDIAGVQAIYGAVRVAPKGNLENPSHQGRASGIGVISGWVCEAQRVEVHIGTRRLRMVYGTSRTDTRGACGDTNNGFVSLVNYNIFGDGAHTARLIVDGQQVGASARFTVKTLGTEFLRGVTGQGTVPLSDGKQVTVQWSESAQGFVITDYTTSRPPTSGEQGFRALIGAWNFALRFSDGESLTRPYSIHEVRTLSNGNVVALGTDPIDGSEFLVISHPSDEYDFGMIDVETLSSGDRFCSFYHFHQSSRQIRGDFAWTERRGTQPDVKSCLSSNLIATGTFTGRHR